MDSLTKEQFKTQDAYIFHLLLRYLHLHMFSYFNRYTHTDFGTLKTLFRSAQVDIFYDLKRAQVTDKPFQKFLTETLDTINRDKNKQRMTFSVETFKRMANRVLLDQDDLFQHVTVAYAPAKSEGYKSKPTTTYFRPNARGLTETKLDYDTILMPTSFSGGKSIVMRVEESDASLPNYWQWVYAFTRYYMDHADKVPADDLLSHVFDVLGANTLPLSPVDVSNIMRSSLYSKQKFSMPLPNFLAVAKTNYYVFWQEGISFDSDIPPYLKETYIFNIQNLCRTFDDPFFFNYLKFIEANAGIDFKKRPTNESQRTNIHARLYAPLLRLLLVYRDDWDIDTSRQKNIAYMGKDNPEDMYVSDIGSSLEAEGDDPPKDDAKPGTKAKRKNKSKKNDDDEKSSDDDDEEDTDEPEPPSDKSNASKDTPPSDDEEKPALFEDDDDTSDDDVETPKEGDDEADDAPNDDEGGSSDRDDGDNTIGQGDGDDTSSSDDTAPDKDASKITLINMDKGKDVNNAFLYRQAVQSMYERLHKQTDDDGHAIAPESLHTLGLWCNQWLWLASIAATRNLVSELGLQKILDKSLKLQ